MPSFLGEPAHSRPCPGTSAGMWNDRRRTTWRTAVAGRTGESSPATASRWRRTLAPRGRGSHVQLRYEHPETGDVRNVTVPQYDRIGVSLLQRIADQCGADDFRARYEWVDESR
jgi:predicted RNA binding protein YcfA (HicA-like mRNA interferase family)